MSKSLDRQYTARRTAEQRWRDQEERRREEVRRRRDEREFKMPPEESCVSITTSNTTTAVMHCESCVNHQRNRAQREDNGGVYCLSCDSIRLNEDQSDFIHTMDCPWKQLCDEFEQVRRKAEFEAERRHTMARINDRTQIEAQSRRIAELEATIADRNEEVKNLRGETLQIKRVKMSDGNECAAPKLPPAEEIAKVAEDRTMTYEQTLRDPEAMRSLGERMYSQAIPPEGQEPRQVPERDPRNW